MTALATSTASADASWPSPPHGAALGRFAAAAQVALHRRDDVRALLAQFGIVEPALLAAWGCGAITPELRDEFDGSERGLLTDLGVTMHGIGWAKLAESAGFIMPTRDPSAPERIVGLVRGVAGQRKHDWLTPPAGLGGAASSFAAERVVLCDGVHAAIAVATAGVGDALLVESPEAIPALLPWLAAKRRVLVTNKKARLQRYLGVLGDLAAETLHVALPTEPSRIPGTLRSALDVQPVPRRIVALPLVTPDLCRRLHAFAAARSAAGIGAADLAALGLDVVELFTVVGAGYLPTDYAAALHHAERAALTSRDLAHTLILPATDERGEVVDLGIWRLGTESGAGRWVPCGMRRQGLLGARVAGVYDALHVVDDVPALATRLRAGLRATLIVRSGDDLVANLPRLAAAGVRRLTLDIAGDIEAVRGAAAAAGVVVEVMPRPGDTPPAAISEPAAAPPPPAAPVVESADADLPVVILDDEAAVAALTPVGEGGAEAAPAPTPVPAAAVPAPPDPWPDPVLIEHDERLHRATFRWGACTIAADTPWQGTSTLEVIVRRDALVHRDVFDLDEPAQVQRFAAAAARRLVIPTEALAACITGLLARLRSVLHGDAEPQADVPPPAAVAAAAEDLAGAADIAERWQADLDALGWVGDEQAKRLVLLACVGRVLTDPPWVVIRGDGAATAAVLAVLAQVIDPALVLVLTRSAEAGLMHQGREGLRQRILLVDDAARLRPDTVVALRILQARGAVASPTALRDPATGRMRAITAETAGPVAVLAAAAAPTALDDLAIVVRLDDTPAQTARVQAAQRARHLHADDAERRAGLAAPWRVFFAGLRSERVAIPFAERVVMPAQRVRDRRDAERGFALIAAHALLHARRRERDHQGALVATEADFAGAELAARGLLGVADDGLLDRTRSVLAAVQAAGGTAVTIPQLAALLPQIPRTTLRAALDDLVRLDVLGSPHGGRGRRARLYRVLPGGVAAVADAEARPRITLLPPGERVVVPAPCLVPVQMAGNGGSPPANITPVSAGA